jgi:ribosomal protein S18 acetylase RimI-like enzyme
MTGMNPIRRATLDDLDEILALWVHYIRVHRVNPAYRNMPPDSLRKRRALFEKHVRDETSDVFVVVGVDGSLEGMLSCFEEDNASYFHPPKYARIQTPFVRPEARGRGHLKRLLDEAYRWARERELTEARLYVSAMAEGANRLAEEHGFEAIAVVRRRAIEWDYPSDPGRQA